MSDLRNHVIKYLAKGIRFDGRKLAQLRPAIVQYGISETAEGSARVKIGNTEILAGVKLSVEKPYPDTPDQGNLMVGAELLPMSSPEFESGPPDIKSIELARVVDRGIRESKMIDTKALVVVKGEKVWTIVIDIVTVNDDGNLLDAASLAALAALMDTRFPSYDGKEIKYREKTDKKLPLSSKNPLAVTVWKIGDSFIVDPTPEEESVVDARLTISTTDDNVLCALQKGGDEPLTSGEVAEAVEIAMEKAAEFRRCL
ncbi:MAG TPA: exosome complex protein Rrp42 [Candidatus Nanoarchaeia archaeon]|nr:exosome complex protein Rrp42 [Candidatus Nanoarchaeia archaeon]